MFLVLRLVRLLNMLSNLSIFRTYIGTIVWITPAILRLLFINVSFIFAFSGTSKPYLSHQFYLLQYAVFFKYCLATACMRVSFDSMHT